MQIDPKAKTWCLSPLSFGSLRTTLKDKSGIGIIVDNSRDYTDVNGV